MTLPALAITGSTGHIGGLVAQHLADAGLSQRLLARNIDKAPQLPGATAITSSYENTEESRGSLTGTKILFMVSASESSERLNQHRAFIDAAAEAGVEHIVYLSFFKAAPDATFTFARDHWATEQHIIKSGVAYTFLRDNFYSDFFPEMVGNDGVLRGPAADGRVASVTRADVARVAAAVLQDPTAHVGQTYDLTGPEALTFDEIAQTITEVTGRPVSFHNETIEEAYESRLAWDAAQWEYDAWVSTYTAIAAGELVPISDAVERITGKRAETLRDFLSSANWPSPQTLGTERQNPRDKTHDKYHNEEFYEGLSNDDDRHKIKCRRHLAHSSVPPQRLDRFPLNNSANTSAHSGPAQTPEIEHRERSY